MEFILINVLGEILVHQGSIEVKGEHFYFFALVDNKVIEDIAVHRIAGRSIEIIEGGLREEIKKAVALTFVR